MDKKWEEIEEKEMYCWYLLQYPLARSAKLLTNVSSVPLLLAGASPGLPYQQSKAVSSRHMAELLSSSRRIRTWSFTLSSLEEGLLTLNCSYCLEVCWHALTNWEEVSGGQAYSLQVGKMALTSLLKLLPPFLVLR